MNKYMMNTTYSFDLNLDIPILRKEIDMFNAFPAGYWNTVPDDYINPELINFLYLHNLCAPRPGTFYSNGHMIHTIHIDGPSYSDLTKINWVYGDDHLMHWYDSSVRRMADMDSIKKRRFIHYSADEVNLIHSRKVGCPCIVQAGIPHNVENISGERRCFSAVLYNRHTDKFVTMNEALEIFKDFVK